MKKNISSEQEKFWIETYAEEYIEHNQRFEWDLVAKGWKEMLRSINMPTSILECGANIGRNIRCLSEINPSTKISAIEISPHAFELLKRNNILDRCFNGSIIDFDSNDSSFELVFSMGVLIHIHPDDLFKNMKRMFDLSSKYILFGEYFSRVPTMIEYRGEKDKLFKRDFGRFFIDNLGHSVNLVDYGFLWGYIFDDGGFDDITWWLFEKQS
jgi:pseudaminic acid biosynthesis-associated methylase